jgi:hypothetical protein
MSDIPLPSSLVANLLAHPEEYELFAVVVDGDVALLIPCHKVDNEMHAAIWSSSPQIVKVDEDIKTIVKPGWLYDGSNFKAS